MKKENSKESKGYIVERSFINTKSVKNIVAEMILSNISANEMLTNNTKKPYNYSSM